MNEFSAADDDDSSTVFHNRFAAVVCVDDDHATTAADEDETDADIVAQSNEQQQQQQHFSQLQIPPEIMRTLSQAEIQERSKQQVLFAEYQEIRDKNSDIHLDYSQLMIDEHNYDLQVADNYQQQQQYEAATAAEEQRVLELQQSLNRHHELALLLQLHKNSVAVITRCYQQYTDRRLFQHMKSILYSVRGSDNNNSNNHNNKGVHASTLLKHIDAGLAHLLSDAGTAAAAYVRLR